MKGKRYKKDGYEKPTLTEKILLITAVLELIRTIIDLIKGLF